MVEYIDRQNISLIIYWCQLTYYLKDVSSPTYLLQSMSEF